ncbi:hypothetical protein ACFQY0_21490, partial [Haloferula chungangensis]
PDAPAFPARLRAVVWGCAVIREAVEWNATVGRRGPSPGIHRRDVWRGSPSREAKARIAAGRGAACLFAEGDLLLRDNAEVWGGTEGTAWRQGP